MKHFIFSPESALKVIRSSGAGAWLHDRLYGRRDYLGLPLALAIQISCAALPAQPCNATPGEWDYTGSLKTARFHHTSTLLPDGRVLVAGGEQGHDVLASAELYDPTTGTWSDTASLNTARDSATATLLPNGLVLVVGGKAAGTGSGSGRADHDDAAQGSLDLPLSHTNGLATAELYDPVKGTWSFTGSLETGRLFHTATLLRNGMVLVAGGSTGRNYLASAELYDPATGTWSSAGSFETARRFHSATLLRNGKVLVAGGRDVNLVDLTSAELWDPSTNTWSPTGSLHTARYDHSATLLDNGMVLVAGGNDENEITSAELYDPRTGTWSLTGNLNVGRADHVETLLPSGLVLVAGGTGVEPDTCELYDCATATWSLTGSLNTMRKDHAATLLLDGMVLVSGGALNHKPPLASAELYEPDVASATRVDGSGTIENAGNTVTFSLRATQSAGSISAESFSFCDPAADVCLTKAAIRNVSIDANTAECSGTGRLDDGTKITYTVDVTDNGEPGTLDTIAISLSNGYSVSGNLTSGDIQIE